MPIRPESIALSGRMACVESGDLRNSAVKHLLCGIGGHRSFTPMRVDSPTAIHQRNAMRAQITVERHRSNVSSFLVGHPAVALLETLPGISEIRVEREDSHRATISYRWKDPGVHSPGISAALLTQGMQLV